MRDYAIIFEDDFIIAINKPSGLLSIPDRYDKSKLNAWQLITDKIPGVLPVHRIDKETSGVLCFAKNPQVHQLLNDGFEKRNIFKEYLALCSSSPSLADGIITAPIAHASAETGKMILHPKGKESITEYHCETAWGDYCYIKAYPKTGRTHQIRVHLACINCPILADPLYNIMTSISISDIKKRVKKNFDQEPIPLISRCALHASKLKFTLFDNEYEIMADMPKDMKACLAQLNKWLLPKKLH
ncbi:MAG: RluA family pseudouridine synthase [Bacteroidota bacterium]|nr:RluA family pseudouridine synthase [Bacteroidota bacterium]